MALNKKIISKIEELITQIRKDNKIKNEIIRDDIFTVLQSECTVLYYPLDEEEIDGFHIEKPVNGKLEQFVYINTANTIEKQVFIAAHELGHIWKVDERLRKLLPHEQFENEEVINRFAAEILMPTLLFKEVIENKLMELGYNGPKIKKTMLVKVIAYLMNYFFVPYKSVVLRFNEIERLKPEYNDIILEYKDSEILKDLIKNEQYTRLNQINRISSIDNLKEYLIEIQEKGLFNETKVCNIYKEFGMEQVDESSSEDVLF